MAAEIIDVEQIDDEIESVESADIVVPVSNKQGDAQDDPIVCSSDDEAALPPRQPRLFSPSYQAMLQAMPTMYWSKSRRRRR